MKRHWAVGPLPDGAQFTAALAAALRSEGVEVPLTSEVLCTRALAAVGLADPARLRTAGRLTLVHRPADFEAYDRAFAALFGGPAGAPQRPPPPPPLPVVLRHDAPDVTEPDIAPDQPPGPEDLMLRFSAVEVLRQADLATLSAAEMAEAHALISALRVRGPLRRGRRQRPTRRERGGSVDLRRTLTAAMTTGGETLTLARRRPAPTPRRLVLLVDVSGSMTPYARALLRFAHVLSTARRRVEVFALGTRLTRLTRSLSTHDPDVALDQASGAVVDWAGGTRLGEALREFNDTWGIRGLARGAVVVILSDGWDRGNPADISEQMARLHRVAWRIIWVNPVAADPDFAPLAAGMAAALPWIDDLRPGHSVASLSTLASDLDDALSQVRPGMS